MRIVPCRAVGAEVKDIDLRDLSAEDERVLQESFADYGLLFFRDQALSELDHVKVSQIWGSININRFFKPHSDYAEIALVEKEPEQTVAIGEGWHTDHSYDVEPALGSMLVAKELPQTGGDTCFVSMYSAFDRLSEGLKRTLLGLEAVHSAKHVFGSAAQFVKNTASTNRIGQADLADDLLDSVHPMVIRHPLSGRPALYVNPGFTLRINGWNEAESRSLLDFLYEHAVQAEFVETFKWTPGSIAFWDNRATWHSAQNDYQGQRRIMHRTTINGSALEAFDLASARVR
ncbi:MAG: TauD/TfdA dioxygenase family protein [Pseudomonadales bacterium]